MSEAIDARPVSAYRIEQALATWQAARMRLLRDDPALESDEAALAELLGPAEADVDEIVARVLRAAVYAEAMERAAAELAKTTASRAKRYETRGAALRGVAFALMEAIGKRKIELPDLTASVVSGKQQVRVTDENLIPDIYVEVVTERKPDKATILSTLKSSVAVPGCELSNGMDYLSIKKG